MSAALAPSGTPTVRRPDGSRSRPHALAAERLFD